MPELPDVAVFKEYLDATALHQTIRDVEVRSPEMVKNASPDRLRKKLVGSAFRESVRHGKFLFVRVDDRGWLVLHFGMTGFLKYAKHGESSPEHVRLLVHFGNGYHLAYDCQRKLGEMGWTGDPRTFARARNLGPDALAPAFDLERFREVLEGRRGRIKSLLMNQAALAGVGNIYADEALFQAGIHPGTPADALDTAEVERLYGALRAVLETAIACRVTPEHFPEDYLLPHREEGAACPKCSGRIARVRISGRSTYFCPEHQRKH